MSKVFDRDLVGSYFKVEEKEDGEFEVLYAPKTAGVNAYTEELHKLEWSHVGYMGNDPNGFDTRKEAEAFIEGIVFEATL